MDAGEIDFGSGLSPEEDGVIVEQPANQPLFGENHAFWLHDEATGIQINGHINTSEELGAYGCRIGKMSIAFPDGRLYLLRESGPACRADMAASPTLRFERIEPFRRWRCTFDGVMFDHTIVRNYRNAEPLEPYRVPVSFEIETEMAAPAWRNGAMAPDGLGPVKNFIGGERYEQLLFNTGALRIGGDVYAFAGQGNRTHRWGARDLAATPDAPRMLGHTWATAIFPSGLGFGFQIYPTLDGGVLWGEGHIIRRGRLNPARVVRVPWLRNYWWGGEKLKIILADDEGEIAVEGETISAVIGQMLPGAQPGDLIPIVQTCVRFSHGGESVINMMERSLRRNAIETGVGRPPDEV